MKDWIIAIAVLGLARYGMDAVGWSDRTQVVGIIVVALGIAGVRANSKDDAKTSTEQDPVEKPAGR